MGLLDMNKGPFIYFDIKLGDSVLFNRTTIAALTFQMLNVTNE